MKFLSLDPRRSMIGRRGLLFVAAALAGCGRNDVEVYRVAREQAPVEAAMPAGHPGAGSGAPSLQWKLPAGWEEVAAGPMRLASFRVAGSSGKQADVSVVPLPGLAGSNLDNVNRWRSQVAQPPVTAAELPRLARPVEIAGQKAELYEQAGAAPGSGGGRRILAAVLRREGIAWFFKMTGDDDLVAQQKPVFEEFLKSLTFAAGTPPGLPASHPPGVGGGIK